MVSYQNTIKRPAPDFIIIGAGIVGLWTAYYAAKAGASVVLIDRDRLGSGASNGILGALMPHQPINWNDKKQYQFEGLTSLPDEITMLEANTGIECGYRRCGRIMPIAHAEKRRQSADWSTGATKNWSGDYVWQVKDDNPRTDWMSSVGEHGYNVEDLAARTNPRALVSALVASLVQFSNVELLEGTQVQQLGGDGTISLPGGQSLVAGKTIVTAGYGSFPLLEGLAAKKLGWGVKGQAALLRPLQCFDPASPIIYDNGTYVIAHDNGHIAIGSTSEREFSQPNGTDAQLDVLIERARQICPVLEGASVVERWADVRPRATGRDPMIGTLPGHPDAIVATGGFKITFAIAHLMARDALAASSGEAVQIPDSFRIEAHL